MKIIPTISPEFCPTELKVFGYTGRLFLDNFSQSQVAKIIGRSILFDRRSDVQSLREVLCGLHYQNQKLRGKLTCGARSAVFDVAVQICRLPANFGEWGSQFMTEKIDRRQWASEIISYINGVISDTSSLLNKASGYSAQQRLQCIVSKDNTYHNHQPMINQPSFSSKNDRSQWLIKTEAFS